MSWIFLLVSSLWAGNHDLSGEISYESRNFFEDGLYRNEDRTHNSAAAKVTYAYSWENDRKVVTFTPFYRIASPDNKRTHGDIREFSFEGAWESWELRAGISKVFWGVTESFHLVDVINQVDLVENTDLEDRLGQPMINPTYVSDYGNFSFFFLPYFRERTFPGDKGRLRFSAVVDTESDALYESSEKESHLDFAARWSHYYDSLEWGLSYFQGTSREPLFVANGTEFLPYYYQMKRVSLDAQMTLGDWLLKTEMLGQYADIGPEYFATVTGFEYTFSNVYGGKDIGILLEYLYDERKEGGQNPFYNHFFVGSRVAFNDALGTELLGGLFFDNEAAEPTSVRLEASRRINNNWKWELEAQAFVGESKSAFFNVLRNDDYLQLNLSYFF